MLVKDTKGKTIIGGNFGTLKKAVAAARNRGISLRGADFTGADLRGVDFSGENLSRMPNDVSTERECTTFAGAQLLGANFEGAQFDGTIFTDADCSGASFIVAYLGWNTRFDRAKLVDCKFNQATRQPWGGNCLYPIFTGADLTNASFAGVRFEGAIFNDANLEGVNFQGSQLHQTNFSGAKLHRADFFDCELEYPFFTLSVQEIVFNLLVLAMPYSHFSEADDDHTRYGETYQVIATRMENEKVHITYSGGTWLSKTKVNLAPSSPMRKRIKALIECWGLNWP